MITFTAILIALAALVYSLAVRRGEAEAPAAHPADPMLEKQETLYENLRDLQFEFRVGKLTEQDYQQAKAELQKELALVTAASGTAAAPPAPSPKPAPAPEGLVCPRCGARFAQPMKFCGECGAKLVAEKHCTECGAKLKAEGRRPHRRFLLEAREVRWDDLIRGPQHVDAASLSDPVLMREDGQVLYTFASVVDDAEMGVTHVVGGADPGAPQRARRGGFIKKEATGANDFL
jgi:cytochrome c-type biogenesis protein CcmI